MSDPTCYPIPGSKLWRAWCARCGAPMRTTETEARLIMAGSELRYCEECSPHRPPPAHTGLTPRQRHKLGKTDGE